MTGEVKWGEVFVLCSSSPHHLILLTSLSLFFILFYRLSLAPFALDIAPFHSTLSAILVNGYAISFKFPAWTNAPYTRNDAAKSAIIEVICISVKSKRICRIFEDRTPWRGSGQQFHSRGDATLRVQGIMPDQQGTALWNAAANGHAGIVHILMDCPDIRLNVPGREGRTPRGIAQRSGHSTVATLLGSISIRLNWCRTGACIQVYNLPCT